MEAKLEIVRHCRTGVRWMSGFMRAWAARTEARVRGREGVGGGGGGGGEAMGVCMWRFMDGGIEVKCNR